MNDFSQAVEHLSNLDVLISIGLLAVVAGLSTWRRLGLVKDLGIGAIRTVVQLALMGYVILFLFRADYWPVTLLVIVVMVGFAGWTALRKHRGRKLSLYPVTSLSIFAGSALTLAYVMYLVIRPDDWADPQYLIPLAGMILGNAMNGTALALERLQSEIRETRPEIEVRLALGATRWQASGGAVRRAVNAALIPSINAMMVVGLVFLPGMMTGQILVGADPVTAAKYQMVVMFMLPAATALSIILAVFAYLPRLFTPAHQLRDEETRTG